MNPNAKFQSADEMAAMIEMWELNCIEKKIEPTIPNLTMFLGFADKVSLYDYAEKGEDFATVIKKGRLTVEESTLQKAMRTNGAGAIFYLKNLGYSDRQTINVDPVTIVIKGADVNL